MNKLTYILIAFLLPLSQQLSAQHKMVFPGKTWEIVKDPEESGLSKDKLLEVKKLVEKDNTSALMIVVNGKVAYQWGEVDRKYNTHSMRKSVLSAMYGKYVREGIIDLEATMADLGIDDNEGLSEEEKKATVRDLLKARSGVYHPALYESSGMKRRKPARFSVRAGTHWYYNNWDFNVLGTIFEQKTGKRFFEALNEDIAQPIGMEDYGPADGTYISGKESRHRAYPFNITAKDLARFGLLMLHMGNWNGKQVIDSAWVAESTRYHSDATLYGSSGYGYMWWVARDFNKYPLYKGADLPEGSYAAQGAGGHHLIIIPAYDMVVVRRVNTDIPGNRGKDFGPVLKLILEARMDK
ncbi:serine hydrolase domain-containing protein [Sphingobacterium sp. SGG-5]|uniref:serine hydrolase domain-containing protein n=1 Tax=Sphingobacterium sp. SGG-5 TaxID=2710881 RepID=UPI0019D106DF|nr:serine hydrolase [Sphingobacterium sp. SGG-5]